MFSELKYLMYSYIIDTDHFTHNINLKPPVYKLIADIMHRWKKDHVHTINQVILHSSIDKDFTTSIFYTDSWLTKKKLVKRSKAQFVIKQYTYGNE